MRLTTLSSWATLGIVFTLVILLLWIWHDVMHRRPEGRHRDGSCADPWDVFQPVDWNLVEDER